MKFNIILADPPWLFRDNKSNNPKLGGFSYPSMSLEDICLLPVSEAADKDCLLFLWITGPKLIECGPKVMEAWGFTPITMAYVWVKTSKAGIPLCGLGHYTRSSTEFVLLGKRGKPKRRDCNVRQLVETDDFSYPYSELEEAIPSVRGAHSVKPEIIQDRIEALLPEHYTKLELFARRHRPGWVCLGNELSNLDIREELRYTIDKQQAQ